MRSLTAKLSSLSFALLGILGSAHAQVYEEAWDEAPDYAVFDEEQGFAELIDGEQAVVLREPTPTTFIEEAPPLHAPPAAFVQRPAEAYEGAMWVDGHWADVGSELSWVEGHYVAPRAGLVFVAPRWSFSAGYYYFFPGYYRPCAAYVQSYFKPYYYYLPTPYAYYVRPPRYQRYQHHPSFGYYSAAKNARGPYWPVGAPGRTGSASLQPVSRPAGAATPALPSRSPQPIGHAASPSRGGAWPSVSPSTFRAPSHRCSAGTSRGFQSNCNFGSGPSRR